MIRHRMGVEDMLRTDSPEMATLAVAFVRGELKEALALMGGPKPWKAQYEWDDRRQRWRCKVCRAEVTNRKAHDRECRLAAESLRREDPVVGLPEDS